MAGFILVAGVLIACVALMMNTAPSGTHNLGLLQQQMMVLHVGIGAAIVGAVLSIKARSSAPLSHSEADLLPHSASPAFSRRDAIVLASIVAGLFLLQLVVEWRDEGRDVAPLHLANEATSDSNITMMPTDDANMTIDMNIGSR